MGCFVSVDCFIRTNKINIIFSFYVRTFSNRLSCMCNDFFSLSFQHKIFTSSFHRLSWCYDYGFIASNIKRHYVNENWKKFYADYYFHFISDFSSFFLLVSRTSICFFFCKNKRGKCIEADFLIWIFVLYFSDVCFSFQKCIIVLIFYVGCLHPWIVAYKRIMIVSLLSVCRIDRNVRE